MTFNVKDINSKPEMTGKALLAASAAVLWGISAPVFADSRQDNGSDSVDLTDSRISVDFDYGVCRGTNPNCYHDRSEEHTSELQSLRHLVCRLLLEKKKKNKKCKY